MTTIISGKEIAENLRNELKQEISGLKIKFGKVPGLAVVQVGNVAASSVYVKAKTKSAKEVGIDVIDHHLPEETTEEDLLKIVDSLNNHSSVNGILVQLPLPKHINEQLVLDSIHPDKDADGFHPLNVGKLSIASHNDENLLVPCTPYGCLIMLKGLGIELSGKNAVVIGRSNIVGKPVSILCQQQNATVTMCHSKTKDLNAKLSDADVVIVAVGVPKFVDGSQIPEGAIVIDVGIHNIDGKLCGDVDFESACEKASAITPVPGGVGPMTVCALIENTIIAAERIN